MGNELENVAFYGGDYGIYTTKASPGWPVMMVDSYFEGQRVAALRCQESGLAMVNLYAKNVPAVFDIDPNYCDKLFLENSYFENVSGPAVVITNENNSNNQITFRNVYCKNVPTLAKYTRSNTATHVAHKIYKVKSYDHGLQMDNMVDMPEYETLVDIEPIQKMPVAQLMDIPALPAMTTWVNLREFGAKGDGETMIRRSSRRLLTSTIISMCPRLVSHYRNFEDEARYQVDRPASFWHSVPAR